MKFPNADHALKVIRDPLAHPSDRHIALVLRHLMHMLDNRRHTRNGAYYREQARKDARYLRALAVERESTLEAHLQNKWENGT